MAHSDSTVMQSVMMAKLLTFSHLEDLIQAFQGVIAISELSFIPLSSLEEHEEKRQRFISRGQKFRDLRGQHMKEHVDGSYADRSLVVRSFSFSSVYTIFFMIIYVVRLRRMARNRH